VPFRSGPERRPPRRRYLGLVLTAVVVVLAVAVALLA
jgi:hypothetical protein